MSDIVERLSNAGRSLGNWNDRHSSHDCRADETLRYRLLDAVSHRLYVLADRYTSHAWHIDEPGGRRSFATLHRKERGEASGPELLSLSCERYWGKGARHTGFSVSGNDDAGGLQFFAGVHRLACGWVSIGSPALFWPALRKAGRDSVLGQLGDRDVVNVTVHGGAVWWSFWHDKFSSSRGTPRWRHGNFKVIDFLLGPYETETETVVPMQPVIVPLPEGSYLAALSIERVTWRRPRWPRVRVTHHYNFDKIISEPGYVPSPGKHGPDGTFGMSGPLEGAPTIPNAIGRFVANVLADRMRRNVDPDYSVRIS